MAAPPVAFILSLIGLLRGQHRTAAIGGMVVSGLCVLCFFGLPLLSMLCK
jgi:hypothetical protein